MEQILDFARNTAKTDTISLAVRSDNDRVIALYKHFGFEKVGTFKDYMRINNVTVSCDIMRMCLLEK